MHILCKPFFLELIFYLGHITESFISNSVHLDGENAVLVQAILSIKAIVKMDPVSHEKVLFSLIYRDSNLVICYFFVLTKTVLFTCQLNPSLTQAVGSFGFLFKLLGNKVSDLLHPARELV
jgi:hypothetical protein